MSGGKFTPTPWKVFDANEGDGHPRPLWVVEGGDARAFYDLSGESEDAPYLRAELHYGTHADAVLMAESPVLLHALERLLQAQREGTIQAEWEAAIKTALWALGRVYGEPWSFDRQSGAQHATEEGKQ